MKANYLKRTSAHFLVIFVAALLVAFTVGPQSVTAQDAGSDKQIKVLLLGTTHLDNPGRDAINPKVPDVLTDQKQQELQTLRRTLADVDPNKVALEVDHKHQTSFDSLYQRFRAGKIDAFATGDFVSKRSEQFQIGFKLADNLHHKHVYAVDHQLPMEIGKIMRSAKKNDPEFLNYFKGYRNSEMVQETDSLLQNESLMAFYRATNTTERVDKYFEPYVRASAVAGDSSYVGADVTAQYYKRNLRIFANLMKVAESGDRIFMLFGAGHQPFLRPLLKDSPRVEFVDPMEYLR